MKTKNEKLEKIRMKYCNIEHNENNYEIGGGLSSESFESRRHKDAKYDAGKLTLGKATQLFKKATGLDTDLVKDVLKYAVPNMEWHHAGKLPKSYGGGMKKTYFLNASEICDIASNWNDYVEKVELSKAAEKVADEKEKNLEELRLDFLNKYAKKVERITDTPDHFHITKREMNGKYGWFDSTYKSYNLTEYYSGWVFESEEKYNEFLNI